MPFDDRLLSPPRRRAPRVEVSAAVELSWLVFSCGRRGGVLDLPDSLTDRADDFWGDGLGMQPEVLVLAGQLGCLTGPDLGPLLALDAVTLPRTPPLTLVTEDDEVREAVTSRLSRLRAGRALRRDYSALLAAFWDAAGPVWQAAGRADVERAVARLRASLDHGVDPFDLVPEGHVARREPFAAMTRAAATAGTVLVTPSYFVGDRDRGHVIDLPGVYSVAVGTGTSSDTAARRGRAEQVASGLKLLADPTRLLILTELDRDPTTVGELARRVGVAQPTASVHVRQLRDAGLLETVREGTTVRYRVSREAVRLVLEDAGEALLAGTGS